MNEPVRIFSDLHLGHKVSRVENVAVLRSLIRGAGTVVFNGDTWQELAQPWRERSAEMLEELKTLCAEEGAEAVFLSGNHDPGWAGCGWLELAGGRIVVTHGDALLFASSPWKREILHSEQRVMELWKEHPEADHQVEERLRIARRIAREMHATEFPTGRHLIQRAWDAAIPPTRAMHMLHAWWTQGDSGAEFCRHYFPKAEVLVIGHFHWAGTWDADGRRIINLGAFLNPAHAHWVEWKDGWLSRGVIDESPEEYRMGRVLDVWRMDEFH
jgi:UDP-2,3-diacylglucosamine pyrophosphatase LpxH